MAYGQRVQNSVFECSGEYATLLEMKQRLLSIIDHNEDSLRFYNLGNRYSEKIEHHGVKPSYDPEGFLVL
jgi:CRISPR-associated protein Cas2